MGLFVSKEVKIFAPVSGKVIPLSEVPDEAVSQGMLGQGCAIRPTGSEILSACDGEVSIFKTKHAITFASKGLEILVHLGIDTVSLEGKGFTQVHDPGQRVKKGIKLLEWDLPFVEKNAKSADVSILIMNSEEVDRIEMTEESEVKAGAFLMKAIKK